MTVWTRRLLLTGVLITEIIEAEGTLGRSPKGLAQTNINLFLSLKV